MADSENAAVGEADVAIPATSSEPELQPAAGTEDATDAPADDAAEDAFDAADFDGMELDAAAMAEALMSQAFEQAQLFGMSEALAGGGDDEQLAAEPDAQTAEEPQDALMSSADVSTAAATAQDDVSNGETLPAAEASETAPIAEAAAPVPPASPPRGVKRPREDDALPAPEVAAPQTEAEKTEADQMLKAFSTVPPNEPVAGTSEAAQPPAKIARTEAPPAAPAVAQASQFQSSFAALGQAAPASSAAAPAAGARESRALAVSCAS
jgi:hypothetical protein